MQLLLVFFLALLPPPPGVWGETSGLCQEHHVCLRRHRIDTRSHANFSLQEYSGFQHHNCSCDLETGKLRKQVIVKVRTGDSGMPALRRLAEMGCAVVDYLPHNSWTVFIPDKLELENLQSLDSVSWIGEYKPRYKVAPEWTELIRQQQDSPARQDDLFRFDNEGRVVATVLVAGISSSTCHGCDMLDFLVRTWSSSLKPEVELVKLGTVDSVQVNIPMNRVREVVRWFARQEWVTWIAPAFRAELGNMYSSSIQQSGVAVPLRKGGSYVPSRPLWGMGILGRNQVVGVGDSGVDLLSCYFRDEQAPLPGPDHRKVLSYRVMWGGDMLDSYGHGSHVAGSVLGQCGASLEDYTVESSKYNGMAPHAKLVFTDIGLGQNTYVTPPVDLGDYY